MYSALDVLPRLIPKLSIEQTHHGATMHDERQSLTMQQGGILATSKVKRNSRVKPENEDSEFIECLQKAIRLMSALKLLTRKI